MPRIIGGQFQDLQILFIPLFDSLLPTQDVIGEPELTGREQVILVPIVLKRTLFTHQRIRLQDDRRKSEKQPVLRSAAV